MSSDDEPTPEDGTEGLLDVQRRTYLLSLAAGTTATSGAGGAATASSTPQDGAGTTGPGADALGYGEGGYGTGLYGGAGPPALPGFSNAPTDPNGDGIFEDIDGNGKVDIFDVQGFFNTYQTDAVQQNAQFFDFDGNGKVDIFDVQALFNEL